MNFQRAKLPSRKVVFRLAQKGFLVNEIWYINPIIFLFLKNIS